MAETYELIKPIMSLPKEKDTEAAYHFEVNILSWYGKEPRLDIRKWKDDRKTGKGASLALKEALEIFRNAEEIIKTIEEVQEHVNKD